MLKAKVDLEKYLEKQVLKFVTSSETINNICEYAEKQYGVGCRA